jgi:hypothetical protein
LRTSCGARDAALRNAVKAVTLRVEDARADGEDTPKPRSAEKSRGDPDVAAVLANGGILAYVQLLLDAGLLEAIDEAAERRGLTRAAFLANAAAGED